MEKPPSAKSKGDVARDVGRAIVSLVPAAGGPLQVAFENLFTSPLEQRKQAWLEQLAEVLTEVEQRIADLTPEKLASNEVFVTVVMQASQVALRNHHKSKLNALRNAVLNAALPSAPEEDEQLTFLRLIDQLAPWHLRVLGVLDNPELWMREHEIQNPGWSAGGPSTVLEHCLPELRGQREIYDQIVRDLQADGLLGQGQFLHTTMTGDGMMGSRTTGRGKRFIQFISAPQ